MDRDSVAAEPFRQGEQEAVEFMSQFVGQTIMPRGPLEPARRRAEVRREVAHLHDGRIPATYLIVMQGKS